MSVATAASAENGELLLTAFEGLIAAGDNLVGAMIIEDQFENIIDTVNGGAEARFNSIAFNIADIDASVNLGLESETSTENSESISSDVDEQLSAEKEKESETTTGGFDIGSIATVAAGAINNGTFSLLEAGEIDSEAWTGSLGGDSFDNLNGSFAYFESDGEGIGSLNIALNTANIDGSVTASLSGVGSIRGSEDSGFNGISTTAAGAINTASVTAAFGGVTSEFNTGAIFGGSVSEVD